MILVLFFAIQQHTVSVSFFFVCLFSVDNLRKPQPTREKTSCIINKQNDQRFHMPNYRRRDFYVNTALTAKINSASYQTCFSVSSLLNQIFKTFYQRRIYLTSKLAYYSEQLISFSVGFSCLFLAKWEVTIYPCIPSNGL